MDTDPAYRSAHSTDRTGFNRALMLVNNRKLASNPFFSIILLVMATCSSMGCNRESSVSNDHDDQNVDLNEGPVIEPVIDAEHPFDQISWYTRETANGLETILTVVITHPGMQSGPAGEPFRAGHRFPLQAIVSQYAAAVLEIAESSEEHGPATCIGFYLRGSREDIYATHTGISIEDLREIASSPHIESEDIVWPYHWIFGEIPAP